MREWRKNLERESRDNGWAAATPDAPLYYERETDCDGTFCWPSPLLRPCEDASGRVVARRMHADRVPGAFGPGAGSLPG